MEVKIGVQHAPRELVLESSATADSVLADVQAALKTPDGLLSLTDDKGRRVIVPVARLAYVEIASSNERRVGFGAA